jgi:hypothetical protein
VMNAYQKIEQLTKMNIDIYESIEEVMNKWLLLKSIKLYLPKRLQI